MKKRLIICIIILSIIAIKILTTFTLNEIVIYNYKKKIYKKSIISFLKKTNTSEKYIVYYNEGNIFYQEKKYDKAINNYKTALEKNPPLKRKCDIRINMSLAMIKSINTNKREDLIKQLEEVKKELYEDHCADESDDSGESKEAEELEHEINDMIEEVKNSDSSSNNNNQENQEQEEKEKEEEQNIENQINEINKAANETRQSDLQTYENFSDYQYYSGKNW